MIVTCKVRQHRLHSRVDPESCARLAGRHLNPVSVYCHRHGHGVHTTTESSANRGIEICFRHGCGARVQDDELAARRSERSSQNTIQRSTTVALADRIVNRPDGANTRQPQRNPIEALEKVALRRPKRRTLPKGGVYPLQMQYHPTGCSRRLPEPTSWLDRKIGVPMAQDVNRPSNVLMIDLPDVDSRRSRPQ